MTLQDALDLAEKLIYAQTGKHLNDLEREVFIGSWQGKTYEEIYPLNPQYVEKYVGYKLWQKLSKALGEKVSKKKIKGALERASQRTVNRDRDGEEESRMSEIAVLPQRGKKVSISHCDREPDCFVAAELSAAIASAGHQPFMANIGAIPSNYPDGEQAWLCEIDRQLQQCDYFLLLLSPQTAVSEMAIEELRQAKELRDSRGNGKPFVLSIRVDCPPSVPLNHDLRNYLNGTPQLEWTSPEDTAAIATSVLNAIATNGTLTPGAIAISDPEINAIDPAPNPLSPIANPPSAIAPPLPVAEPELPKGQVRLASAFYIDRVPHEAQCYKEILHPGALIRLKAPRQMGKTSLMARILDRARERGYRTVPLSFQHADRAVFTNLNELLRWFCARITRKLRLPHQVDEYWTDTYGSKDNCTAYFEDVLLPQSDTPLVLGLDEVDRVFQYPKIADDFFGLLRAWYEEAGYGDRDSHLWEKLRLVVVHSTEVYIPLDVNQSPFNVGLPIELSELNPEQVLDLARRHGLNWQVHQVEKLMGIVGGHPYLVRLALYNIIERQFTLEELVAIAPTEAGLYGDHLRRHLWNLQQHPDLEAAFRLVVTQDRPIELESVLAFKLHSLGLVQLQGNQVTPRFHLYRQYFSDRLSV